MKPNSWLKKLDDYLHAVGGAFLFGVPLIYTMEMWWLGTYTDFWKLLVLFGLAFVANLHLAYFAGFKRQTTIGASANQAVDAIAVGIACSVVLLYAQARIRPGDPLDSVAGKVLLQGVPLSIGASLANSLVPSDKKSREGQQKNTSVGSQLLADLGATVAGNVLIALSIAPTQEVPRLAANLEFPRQLALVALSLVITYIIVFESGFSLQRPRSPTPLQGPLSETVTAYAVSLAVVLLVLYLLAQIHPNDPPDTILAQVIVLGFPAAIGGAGGRLVA